MKSLNQSLVDTVASELSGKRLEKFMISVKAINESLEAGGWTKGSSQKRGVGFGHSDLATVKDVSWEHPDKEALREIERYISYGKETKYNLDNYLQYITIKKKHTLEGVKAYADLYVEFREACDYLDSLRPLPVITKIGLSPTVTKTFKEMNLDLDINSIKLAEIVYYEQQKVYANPKNPNYGKLMFDREGKPVMERIPYVKWSEGIKHGRSRFSARKQQCEACGHGIPSGNFVAIEAFDKKNNELISLWTGCDCAKNIFGIKDVGIKRTQEE